MKSKIPISISTLKIYCTIWIISFLLINGAHSQIKAKEKLPNIIVIFVDDLGYGDLSSYGHPTIRTPNIDSMANQGIRFTQFYVGANVCTPSRAALLTGRLPVRYGLAGAEARGVFFPNSSKGLPPSEITIAKALKSKNYKTGIIGKWHLGHLPEYLPTSHGFDYFFGIPYSNDMIPQNNDWPALPVFKNTEVIETDPDQRYLTKRYTEEAINFIKNNKNNPFFLYYPNNFPHVPLYASDEFSGQSKRGLYGDVVSELDWSVGKILQTLRDLKIEENTMVIFTSDNGPWLLKDLNGGSAGLLFEGKGSAYEGGMRVPAIAWWPGTIKPNQVCDQLATTMDLFPTILKLAEVKRLNDREYDGVDIWPLFAGENKPVRDLVYYYHRSELYAIRKGEWKAHFITKPSYRPDIPLTVHDLPVLFNLNIDPSEKYNVSMDHPEVVKELTTEFHKHKASIKKVPNVTEETYWQKSSPPNEWWKGKK
ncbi:MAG: sulfatase family protein [Chitinophagaceae bacterium]